MVFCKEPPSPLAMLRRVLLKTLGERKLRREERAMGTAVAWGGFELGSCSRQAAPEAEREAPQWQRK